MSSGWENVTNDDLAAALVDAQQKLNAAVAQRDKMREALDRIRRLDHTEGHTLDRARGIALDALAALEEGNIS